MTQPEQVTLTHPETGGVFSTSREAFDGLWKDSGWVEADPHAAVAASLTDGAVSDLTKLHKPELVELATSRGIDATGKTKDDLIDALESSA